MNTFVTVSGDVRKALVRMRVCTCRKIRVAFCNALGHTALARGAVLLVLHGRDSLLQESDPPLRQQQPCVVLFLHR